MFSFLFGNKKSKETPGRSPNNSNVESLTENARTPGDVETYVFSPPAKFAEQIFISYDSLTNAKNTPQPAPILDPTEILNEKVLTDLLAKYSIKTPSSPLENRRKSSSASSSESDEASLSNLKTLKESLSRIARYNNKRKYDERLGFASTLSAKAEEIGRRNTIKFLLKVIDEQLVF